MDHPPTFLSDSEIPAALCTTIPPIFVNCDSLNDRGSPVGRQWVTSGSPVGLSVHPSRKFVKSSGTKYVPSATIPE